MTNAIRHILVVDDNPSIHEDFWKIFAPLTAAEKSLAEASARLFDAEPEGTNITYELEFASQGSEALEMVAKAIATQRPYSMAFIDIQMPPGWDGIETMGRIREIAPELQFVICTASSNCGLNDIARKAGRGDGFAVIKKPFEAIEVLQLANVLGEKAHLLNEARERARKLEESQHRYRFLAEAMPGMVWTATANGNADYFNQQWCDYTGMSFEQSKDWGWQSAIHPEDLPHSLEEWTRALRTGENFESEYRVMRASDSAYRWQLHRAVPMRNQQEQILHWVCACTDIHDKKRTEYELREAKENLERHVAERTLELMQSEARYRELVNGQGEGVVYTDAEMKFIFANPAAESFFGLWPGQLLGRRLEEFLDERNRAVLQQQIKRRRAGEKSRYEIGIMAANGERRQVLITGAPKIDSTGRLCGTFAIFSDITQLKNVEIALRESQRLLSAVLNNIPDPAWLKDSQGRYLVGNKPLAEVYRRSLEDIIGKTVFEAFPSAAASLMEGDRQIVASGKSTRTEVCLPDSDGNSRWFDTIETPIFNENGQLASTVGIARDVSDYKRVESALRESEARYLELLNSLDDGVVIVDGNQVFTFANPALGRILELPVQQLLGRNFREFLDNEQRMIVERQVARRKAGEKTSYEVEVTTGSGQRRQIFVTSTPKMDGNGRLVGTFSVARDITERKRTEEKLHLQISALAATANGIVITDASGKILWVNPAFSRLTGYSEAEVIGKTPAVLKSGAHSNEFYKELWTTIREGKVWHGDMVNRRKDGSTYYEEASITPVLDERGAIKNFVAVKQDVSRRKHDEAQLRDREEAFRALADNVPDAVVRVDRDMRLVYGNRAFAKDVRKEPEMFLGKTGEELNLPVAEKWRRELMEVFRTGNPRGFEFELAGPDGTSYREARLVPERSSTGEVEFVLAVTRDVTERKKAEMERQLLDLQLRQAQKMEAIGQLAAGIAHEINTPTQYVGDNTRFLKDAFENITAALHGYAELIAAAKANAIMPETLARAEEILSSSDLQYQFEQIPAAIKETLEGVDRVSKIVRAMKEFSHPGGREKSAADLNKAIDSTVMVARNEWKYVADMVLDLQPDLPLAPCFIGEFNQAILNLVINAAHAIADVIRGKAGQKGTITIRTRREGDCVEVRVSDTGTGIPEEHRHRIFEPFFTTKDVGKGTGQGLTVVYSSIVKKHGGTVTFETETGKGTTFILRLPLVSRGTSPATAEPSKEAVRLSAPPSLTAA